MSQTCHMPPLVRTAIAAIAVHATAGFGSQIVTDASTKPTTLIDYDLFAAHLERCLPSSQLSHELEMKIRDEVRLRSANDWAQEKAAIDFLDGAERFLLRVERFVPTAPSVCIGLIYARLLRIFGTVRALEEARLSGKPYSGSLHGYFALPEKELYDDAVLNDENLPEPLWHFFLCRAEQGDFGTPVQNINRALVCPVRGDPTGVINLHRHGRHSECSYCCAAAAAVAAAATAATATVPVTMPATVPAAMATE